MGLLSVLNPFSSKIDNYEGGDESKNGTSMKDTETLPYIPTLDRT